MHARSSRPCAPKAKRSRQYKNRDARQKISLGVERLEERALLALGPTLVAIQPNTGSVLSTTNANLNLRNIAPTDLTFRFDDGQVMTSNTAVLNAGIKVTRSGGDGVFGSGGAVDIPVVPGFIGLGETPNEIVFRFAERLPDDVYQITVGAPLTNAGGDAFDANRTLAGNQDAAPLTFRLDLGAKIVSVVPQPITRNPATGALSQSRNTIDVFFNANDPLVAGTSPVTTSAGNPTTDPTVVQTRFYQLFLTQDTTRNTDDLKSNPTSVTYDPVSGKATLTFGQVVDLANLGVGTMRLRIGTDELIPTTPTISTVVVDPGSSFGTATNLATLAGGGTAHDINQHGQILAAAIEPQFYELDLPGANDEPGHRDINTTNHLFDGADSVTGIETVFYNFRDDYGADPDGIDQKNAISNDDTMKTRAREVFEVLGHYYGVKFVETATDGITVAVGDVRVINPLAPTGANGTPGLFAGTPALGLIVLNAARSWNLNYGGDFFQEAMFQIDHVLGLGNSFDLPPNTVQGDDATIGVGIPEPVFPGDQDIVHGQYLMRPESKDIDLYQFTLSSAGTFSAETFAERLSDSSLLDTALRLYKLNVDGSRTLISQNDDYYSKDSFVQLDLAAGTYFIGVSASGNTSYDPTVVDSGFGGTSQGVYQLRLDFHAKASNFIVDSASTKGGIATTSQAFDGDADGVPGGVYNFWFRSQTAANTIIVDKATATPGAGSINAPFVNIGQALAAAAAFTAPLPGQGKIVRIVGNGVAGGASDTARPYEFGATLADGPNLTVPKDTTVMIDAGAVLKFDKSYIATGSSSASVDRSGAALQVLGTPKLSVFFTSYNDATLGLDTNSDTTLPGGGDWGGILFQDNIDKAINRFVFGNVGSFVNYVNNADIRFGGGSAKVDGIDQTVNPIEMLQSRPTVSFNKISRSADAAIAANPDSFEETNFHAPPFQTAGVFTNDYVRIGPEIHDNQLLNNTVNALLVRTKVTSTSTAEALTVAGRFDDTDIVHFVSENLVIQGTSGGPIQDAVRPPVGLVTVTGQAGGTLTSGNAFRYLVTFVDANGNEGPLSINSTGTSAFTSSVLLAPGETAVRLDQLPTASLPFVARRIYRSVSTDGGLTFGAPQLVQQIDPNSFAFVDVGTTVGGAPGAATVPSRSRLDGRLAIDPGVVVKTQGARIEAQIGANLIAEGLDGRRVVFTSLRDDRFGGSGTFDTNNNGLVTTGSGGDWGGLIASPNSKLSLDFALVAFGGGIVRVGGSQAGFNAVEIYQADARITNSVFELNADGVGGQAPNDRFGFGFNTPSTIFVRGSQPIILNNQFRDNNRTPLNQASAQQAVISINANALNHFLISDYGRSTGNIGRFTAFGDNQGPLVRKNRLDNNAINGMVVRGGTLTTQSVWDDTDIVHVLLSEIQVPDFHTYGGLRIQSSATESLVVKLLGTNAGLTATGRPLEITDRIGGSLTVLGQPGFPVIFTSLTDDTVGAGFRRNGKPQNDTNNDGVNSTLPVGPEVDNGTLIDNDVAANTVGHFQYRPLAGGGNTGNSGVTAQGSTLLFNNQNFIFDFLNLIDVGAAGNGIDLASTTITLAPTLVSPDLVASEGSFAGANGTVNWRVESRFDNGVARLVNTIQFSSANPLGALRFINYLDEDVGVSFSDDLLSVQGTPGQPDFRLFTLDGPQRVGFSQGGFYSPGNELVNATYDGWAADEFDELETAIRGATGATYSVAGTVDTTDLIPFNDPQLGPVFGLEDVTTAMAWTVNPNATSATITSFLELVARNPGSSPGEWRSLRIDEFANDRNVDNTPENESSNIVAPGSNATINSAQFLGSLAPNEKSGDDNLRLGFEVHGFLSAANDVDVYSFKATTGTEVWFDIDRTASALDSIVELLNANGDVLARSNDSLAELSDPTLFTDPARGGFAGNSARLMQKDPPVQGQDFWSTNPKDAGMRVVLTGPANTENTYHVRVRSNSPNLSNLAGGLTSGVYQLQLRLREKDEVPGSTIRLSNIKFATNGIEVFGQPTHSPLAGESAEDAARANNSRLTAQELGNLFTTDRATLSVAGSLSSSSDVDFYHFTILPDQAPDGNFGVTFDIDYADSPLGRPDTSIAVFQERVEVDQTQLPAIVPITVFRLVYLSEDPNRRPGGINAANNINSNIADDIPGPLAGLNFDDLNRGSGSVLDPYIGTVQLASDLRNPTFGPTGHYYVAVMSDASHPTEQRVTATVRLVPIESTRRVAEDNIDSAGGSGASEPPVTPILFGDHFTLVAPRGDQLTDGETFSITDNLGVQRTFEFDRDGITTGANIPVSYASTDSAGAVALTIRDTIIDQGLAGITSAAVGAGIITITGDRINLPPFGITAAFTTTSLGVRSVSQNPAPGQTANALYVGRPSQTPFNLGDVGLFVSRDHTGSGAPEQTQLFTVDPFTGALETFVGVFNRDVRDIAIRLDTGEMFAYTTDREKSLHQDATDGHYLRIDTGNATITDLGDDGIDTFIIDPASTSVPPGATKPPSTAFPVGVGVDFNATTFGFKDGIYQMFAVGNRGDSAQAANPNVNGNRYRTNILYQMDPNTGVALSQDPIQANSGRPGPNSVPQYRGAGSDVVERGQIRTTVDSIGGTGNVLIVPEATDFLTGGPTTRLLTDGLHIFVDRTVGAVTTRTTFELDLGVDVTADLVAGTRFVKDGDFFALTDGALDQIFQFDTGPILNFTNRSGNFFSDGQTFTFTNGQGTATVFELNDTQNPNGGVTGTNRAINFAGSPGFTSTTMANAVASAINNAGIGITATVNNLRISLTGDIGLTTTPAAGNPTPLTFIVEGNYGVAPTLQPDATKDLTGVSFNVSIGQGTNVQTRTFRFGNAVAPEVNITYSNGDSVTTVLSNMQSAINGALGLNARATTSPGLVAGSGLIVIDGENVSVTGITLPNNNSELITRTVNGLIDGVEESSDATVVGPRVVTIVNNALVFRASNDGTRINFLGPTSQPNAVIRGDFAATAAFAPQGTVGGSSINTIPIALQAADGLNLLGTQHQVANSIRNAINAANIGVTATINPANPDEVIINATGGATVAITADAPFQTLGQAPGGNVTGLAMLGNRMYAVSDTGGLFEIQFNATSDSGALSNGAFLTADFINSATALVGKRFAGLVAGPTNVENGRYSNLLFGITETGELLAFNAAGILQPIFVDGATSIQVTLPSNNFTATAGSLVTGLAFSNLDVNLWHVSSTRAAAPGAQGGASLHFGYESTQLNYGRTPPTAFLDPTNANNYNFPGGAYGSVVSNPFSLEGYSAADQPVLYFDYFADIGGGDSFRVFVSSDTTAAATPPLTSDNVSDWTLLPATLVNTNGQWLQVRVPLDGFAGRKDLRLRFDFSTASDMDVGEPTTTGDEFRAIDASQIPDGTTFVIDGNRTFEFDRGITLDLAPGARIVNDSLLTIQNFAGQSRIFQFIRGDALATGTNIKVQISDNMSASQVAEELRQAIVLSALVGVTPFAYDNFINLGPISSAVAPSDGAFAITGNTTVGITVTGARGVAGTNIRIPINAGMDSSDVINAMVPVLTRTFVPVANQVVGAPQIKSYNDVVRIIGHQVTSRGLLGIPAFPTTVPNPTQNRLPGDAQNNNPLPAGGNTPVGFHSPTRGQDNLHEGVYLDRIIIGFAERGERVLLGTTTQGDNTSIDPPDPNLFSPTQILTGDYQLEIRRSSLFGSQSFDTNDRLTSSVTFLASPGMNLIDGQIFTLGDGVNQVVFEYNDLASTGAAIGVAAGRQQVNFRQSMTAQQVARNVRDAINSAAVQNTIRVQAAISDGVVSGNTSTGTVVNLFGPAVLRTGDVVISEFVGGAFAGNDTLANAFNTGLTSANRASFYGTGNIGDNERLLNPDPTLSTPGLDVDMLRVQLNTGDRIQINVNAAQLGSSLDPLLHVFDAAGNDLLVSDDDPAPGERTSLDSYIDFTAPFTGSFFIGVSGFINGLPPFFTYDPTVEGSGVDGSTGFYNIEIKFGLPGSTTIDFATATQFGDQNLFRDQGQILIQQNIITDAAQFGIVVDATPRDPVTGQPQPGSVRKTPTTNTNNWIPGPTLANNVVVRGGTGGILYSGDSTAGPTAPISYGRIINNTVVGNGSGTDVGIRVSDGAAPTLLNNIVSNLGTGVNVVDARSSTTEIHGMLYDNNNVRDFNIRGTTGKGPNALAGDSALFVPAGGKLFVNALTDNYYIADGSIAIDSGLDSIDERQQLHTVKQPLGIADSTVLAPEFDVTGQRRVDVAGVGDSGSGTNPFKDRGAFDRADFTKPSAILIDPQDNDAAGADQEAAVSIVRLDPATILSNFAIQLVDGFNPANPLEGTGIDDSTVTVDKVTLTFNGVVQTPGINYTIDYDSTNNILRLVPLTGIWLPGNYVLKLENSPDRFLIQPVLDPSAIIDGQSFSVTDKGAPAKTALFEFDTGFNVLVPAAGGASFANGQTFSIQNGAAPPVVFTFDDGTGTGTNRILFKNGATNLTQDQIANNIVASVASVAGLGLTPTNVGGGRVVLGGTNNHSVQLQTSPLTFAGFFGVQGGRTSIAITPTMTTTQVANAISAAINAATAANALSGVTAAVLTTGEVLLQNAISLNLAGTPTMSSIKGGIQDLAGNPLNGNQPNGETRFTILLAEAVDFGDAPDSFQTTIIAGGAQHRIDTTALYALGASVTADADGQPDANANADVDDGVTIIGTLRAGTNAAFDVDFRSLDPARQNGFLNAWADFNGNGQFDAGEQFAVNFPMPTPGHYSVPITIPSEVPGGGGGITTIAHDTVFRFRLSSQSNNTGFANLAPGVGEVEDYRFNIDSQFPFRNPESLTVKIPGVPNGISPPIASAVVDGQTFSITDNSAPTRKTVVFEYDSGLAVTVPAAGGAAFTKGQTFSLQNGATSVTFTFDDGTGAGANRILFASGGTNLTRDQIANNIVTAVSAVASLGLTPVNVGSGRVVMGGTAASNVQLQSSPLTRTGAFGVQANRRSIAITPTMTAAQMANAIANAINAATTANALSGVTATVTTKNDVQLQNFFSVDVTGTPTMSAFNRGQAGHLDVNNDGRVDSRDVFAIVAAARANPPDPDPPGTVRFFNTGNQLPNPAKGPTFPQGPGGGIGTSLFVDTSGPGGFSDNFFTTADVLAVVAQLRFNPAGEAEAVVFVGLGEGEAAATPQIFLAGEGQSVAPLAASAAAPVTTATPKVDSNPALSAGSLALGATAFAASPGVSTGFGDGSASLSPSLTGQATLADLFGSRVALASGAVRRLEVPVAASVAAHHATGLESILSDIANEVSDEWRNRLALDSLFGAVNSPVPAELTARTTLRSLAARRGRA